MVNKPLKLRLNERVSPAVPPSQPSRELQVFANPAPERDYVIRFDVPEFTCLCPLMSKSHLITLLIPLGGRRQRRLGALTGQPDFAHFTVQIVADQLCVETKSLKQYFWSCRNEGAFHEKVTNMIVSDLVKATQPRFLRLHADWFVRGGIRTCVTAEHRKKGWKPAPKVELPGELV